MHAHHTYIFTSQGGGKEGRDRGRKKGEMMGSVTAGVVFSLWKVLLMNSESAESALSPQVLDVLCSLCVCHGVAVRSNQHLICDNLLPGRDLLLQTRLVNHVSR